MLCTHKTTILCQFGLFCHKLTTISPPILSHFWWELYQNGVAERRIHELQEMTRVMLIHTIKRWPGVVTIHLWPYAIRMANQAYNAMPLTSHANKQSPNKIFDNSVVDINQKHWKPFDVQLMYSNLSSKGPREYTQNGMPDLKPASTWGNPQSTIETWHWF